MSDFDKNGRVHGVILGGIGAGLTGSQEIQEAMARELIDRRARDLSDADHRALRWAREWLSMEGHVPQSVTNQQTWREALDVLDRLLAAAEGK